MFPGVRSVELIKHGHLDCIVVKATRHINDPAERRAIAESVGAKVDEQVHMPHMRGTKPDENGDYFTAFYVGTHLTNVVKDA